MFSDRGGEDDAAAASAGLPPGWTAAWSRSRSAWYYRRDEDGQTTWVKPLPGDSAAEPAGAGTALPAGWEERHSRSKNRPYWSHQDGRTTWDRSEVV